jgi:hypothetical protein
MFASGEEIIRHEDGSSSSLLLLWKSYANKASPHQLHDLTACTARIELIVFKSPDLETLFQLSPTIGFKI